MATSWSHLASKVNPFVLAISLQFLTSLLQQHNDNNTNAATMLHVQYTEAKITAHMTVSAVHNVDNESFHHLLTMATHSV